MIVKIYKHHHKSLKNGKTLSFKDFNKSDDPIISIDVPKRTSIYSGLVIFADGQAFSPEELIEWAKTGKYDQSNREELDENL